MSIEGQKVAILAIDPGEKNVGIMFSSQAIQFERELNLSFTVFISLVISNLDVLIQKAVIANAKIILIIEDFILYKHKADVQSFAQMQTSEMIGSIISHYSNYNYPIEIVKQNASQAKVWDNDRLLRLGFFTKKGNNYMFANNEIKKHTRDAFRHLIYYTNKNYFNKCITLSKLEEWFQTNWFLW